MVDGGTHRHRPHMAHVGGNGKAKEQHLHDGDAEEDEHRALVAQDVACLLEDEGQKLFHWRLDCRAKRVNTPSMSGWWRLRFNSSGVPNARIFPSTMMEMRSQYSASSM